MKLKEKILVETLTNKEKNLLNKKNILNEEKYIFNKYGYFKKKNFKHSKNFKKQIERILKKQLNINFLRLEDLHYYVSSKNKNYIQGGNKITTNFYDALDYKFYEIYKEFIIELKKIFKFRFLYQKVPTIRIPCPGGLGKEYFPFYHSDLMLGHPHKIINIWLPITKKHSIEGNTFRIINLNNSKKIYKKYDYDFERLMKDSHDHKYNLLKFFKNNSFDADVNEGEMIVFDPRCLHTAVAPIYKTRVSIDIRIYPLNEYHKEKYIFRGKGRRKILYDINSAYNLI